MDWKTIDGLEILAWISYFFLYLLDIWVNSTFFLFSLIKSLVNSVCELVIANNYTFKERLFLNKVKKYIKTITIFLSQKAHASPNHFRNLVLKKEQPIKTIYNEGDNEHCDSYQYSVSSSDCVQDKDNYLLVSYR